MRGARSAKPTTDGDDRQFGAAEKLTIVLDAIRNDRPATEVCRKHGIDERDFRRWRDEMIDGAARAMAIPGEAPRSYV